MERDFQAGDAVQTPFGKGRVRALENGGRLVVEIRDRTLIVRASDATLIEGQSTRDDSSPHRARASRERAHLDSHREPANRAAAHPNPHRAPAHLATIDLHGLVVEEALARIDQSLNDALLAGTLELRFIHGRSGGRLRGALHRRLREISSVRHFALDPHNPGVTVVTF